MDGDRGERQAPRARSRDRDGDQAHRGGLLTERSEALPFDVEVERLPIWTQLASLGVIIASVPVALKLVPGWVFVPFLLASSLGRRFISTAAHAVVDERGLSLDDELVAPRSEIGDVWLDGDEREPRVVVTSDAKLFVLWFANRTQAERCRGALLDGEEPRAIVAGHSPRPVDLLASLRFVAIALPFIFDKNLLALLVVLVAAPSFLAFVRARQVIATKSDVTIRSWRGSRRARYDEIEKVDEDTLFLRDGGTLTIARASIRDVLLTTPAWTERAHERALQYIRGRVK